LREVLGEMQMAIPAKVATLATVATVVVKLPRLAMALLVERGDRRLPAGQAAAHLQV